MNTQVAAFFDSRIGGLAEAVGLRGEVEGGDGAYAMGSCIVMRDSILMASSLVRSTLLEAVPATVYQWQREGDRSGSVGSLDLQHLALALVPCTLHDPVAEVDLHLCDNYAPGKRPGVIQHCLRDAQGEELGFVLERQHRRSRQRNVSLFGHL